MAIIVIGSSKCPLCGGILKVGDVIVATTHFLYPFDSLYEFSDAGMHNACFLNWDRRQEFIDKYNEVFQDRFDENISELKERPVIPPSRVGRKNTDELTKYIIFNYGHLMTELERRQQLLPIENLTPQADSADQDQFMLSMRERIMREHKSEIMLNRCPKCNALARTPTAKQCPKCFHSWRESA